MADDDKALSESQLYLVLIIFGSSALVLTVYHFVRVIWYDNNRHHPAAAAAPRQQTPSSRIISTMVELKLIPAYKYRKGMRLVGEGGGGTCAVCLCDFEEDEELRTLLECKHSFHAPCVDMWLYSHSNCPVCRADAAPPLQIVQQRSGTAAPRVSHGYRRWF